MSCFEAQSKGIIILTKYVQKIILLSSSMVTLYYRRAVLILSGQCADIFLFVGLKFSSNCTCVNTEPTILDHFFLHRLRRIVRKVYQESFNFIYKAHTEWAPNVLHKEWIILIFDYAYATHHSVYNQELIWSSLDGEYFMTFFTHF